MRNVPDIKHGRLLTELAQFLGVGPDEEFGELFSSTNAVALDFPARGMAAQYVSHPDLVYVRGERAGIIADRVLQGVPDLMGEILSPTTEQDHPPRGALRRAYERHGVPPYWLVDPAGRSIALHTLEGEPYAGGHYGPATILRPGAALNFPLPPGQSVPVVRLFRHLPAPDLSS